MTYELTLLLSSKAFRQTSPQHSRLTTTPTPPPRLAQSHSQKDLSSESNSVLQADEIQEDVPRIVVTPVPEEQLEAVAATAATPR